MRTIVLEKSFTKYGREPFPRPFSKKSKLSVSLDQRSKGLYSLFLLYAKWWAIKLKLRSCRPLAFTSYKAFLKINKRSGSSLPASFSA